MFSLCSRILAIYSQLNAWKVKASSSAFATFSFPYSDTNKSEPIDDLNVGVGDEVGSTLRPRRMYGRRWWLDFGDIDPNFGPSGGFFVTAFYAWIFP